MGGWCVTDENEIIAKLSTILKFKFAENEDTPQGVL